MTDALAGYAYRLVEELTLATGRDFNFFGGGAGDDGQFSKTHSFAGTRALTNTTVEMRVTEANGPNIGARASRLDPVKRFGLRWISDDGFARPPPTTSASLQYGLILK